MAEVERDWKDVIIQKGGLVNILYNPRPASGLYGLVRRLAGVFYL